MQYMISFIYLGGNNYGFIQLKTEVLYFFISCIDSFIPKFWKPEIYFNQARASDQLIECFKQRQVNWKLMTRRSKHYGFWQIFFRVSFIFLHEVYNK